MKAIKKITRCKTINHSERIIMSAWIESHHARFHWCYHIVEHNFPEWKSSIHFDIDIERIASIISKFSRSGIFISRAVYLFFFMLVVATFSTNLFIIEDNNVFIIESDWHLLHPGSVFHWWNLKTLLDSRYNVIIIWTVLQRTLQCIELSAE